jgi:hypothetical protein
VLNYTKHIQGNRGKLDNKHWYDHVPKLDETSCQRKVTILRNQQVQINRTIPNSKLDIIICDNKKATCMLIDVSISGDRNAIHKEDEILKYKDLITEIQCMWQVKAKQWQLEPSQHHSDST